MVEFYQAYADHHELMDLTEDMLRSLAEQILGSAEIEYQGQTFDFGKPFVRMTGFESILHHNPHITAEALRDMEQAKAIADKLDITLRAADGLGRIQTEIFEETVEHKLLQPTFITAYPTEVSPLARRNDDDPFVTDRFELFIGGREIDNGF